MSSALPSGTVTFLFTDIERSTENIAALGDESYADVQETHRKLLREAFEANNGVEVGTEGDAFFVAFTRAGDAVNAAMDGQRALDGHPLRVRMGIHTGEAVVREGDYVGHDVHKAKRVQDAGHGGQILLSQATAELVRDAFTLVDLGPHRLKDLGEPQRIFQVGDAHFPRLRSLETFRHNLPTQRSAFVGREKEIAEITTLLEGERLVTLTGVGGCGKTRLAQQVGAELLESYPDGVFFVDLAQLADPDVVPATLASAVGVPMAADLGSGLRSTTDELLFNFLGHRTCLVILDNCEHLLDACAEIADRILTDCSDVRMLATSREALDVDGEQPIRVPSLSLPEDGDAQSSEAVSLFKARAKTARADFDLTPQNIDAVAEICRRLDGIPLAIEFAAARVSHLSPKEIAERLGDMFKLLAGGRRRRIQRQQTLQAALDWSYELLSETERVLMRRLAVFPASFPLEAAEGICSGDGVEARSVLDLLGSLIAKSLVTTAEEDGKTRYRLIETVRLYATEKLRAAEEADLFRTRHRDWFYDWVSSFTWDELISAGPAPLRIADEQASLRAALEWSEEQDRTDLVVGMAARMRGVWVSLGHWEEGLRWLISARAEDLELTSDERVAALSLAAFLTNIAQQPGSAELRDRAIVAAGSGPSAPLGWAHNVRAINLGIANQWTGDPELAEAARREILESIRAAEGSPRAMATAKTGRGLVEMLLGDYDAAAEAYTDAPYGGAIDLAQRATVHHILGDHGRAEMAARRFFDLVRKGTEEVFWSAGIGSCTAAVAGSGDVEGGKAALLEFFDAMRRSGRPGAIEDALVGAAALAYITGDPSNASRLLGFVRARTFDAGRILPAPSGYPLYQHYVRLVRAALDGDDARRLLAEGRALTEEQAIALGLEILDA